MSGTQFGYFVCTPVISYLIYSPIYLSIYLSFVDLIGIGIGMYLLYVPASRSLACSLSSGSLMYVSCIINQSINKKESSHRV